MKRLVLLAFLLHAATAAPQFVSFKDGRVGVNFGGYHAAAGLGGLLTGDAAHGGLSASAGTPWGQNAAAGLGGAVNGRVGGAAYAGAQANSEVGASALLGGTAGEGGFSGSEAHANGRVHSKTVSHTPLGANAEGGAPFDSNAIQKIRPHKKYTLIKDENLGVNKDVNVVHSKRVQKTVYGPPPPPPPPLELSGVPQPPSTDLNVQYHSSPGLIGNVLNIPIGILRSLQESLAGVHVDKSVSINSS